MTTTEQKYKELLVKYEELANKKYEEEYLARQKYRELFVKYIEMARTVKILAERGEIGGSYSIITTDGELEIDGED